MPVPPRQGLLARSLLRDDAFRLIRDALIDGTLAPGERLNDADLSSWLGVSRTPIREALARLERAGLVQTKPGRSTIVSPLDASSTRFAQSVAAAMHELAVREALPQFTADDIDAMREANESFADALRRDDVEAALTADDAFHQVAVTASLNPVISSVLDQVTPLVRRAERLRFSSLIGRDSITLHAQIIDRCVAGETEEAGLAARANWLTLQLLDDTQT
jgi:DNA-binding GntR family transcriptional regulator